MKINCDVVQDLMQGYVEGSLSEESIKLVEEHVAKCEACKAKLEEIKQINDELDGVGSIFSDSLETHDHNGEAGSFKSFKRVLFFQKLMAIFVAIALTGTVCYGVFDYVLNYNSYVPYEEADISINSEGDVILDNAYNVDYTNRYLVDSSTGERQCIVFVHLSSSIYQRHHEKPVGVRIIGNIVSQGDHKSDYSDDILNENVIAVYYASKDFLKSQIYKNEWEISSEASDGERQAVLDEIAEGSVLLWEKN